MNNEDIQKQIEEIEVIHKLYTDKLLELKRKQDEIINDFGEALKNKKIDGVRKSIAKL